MIFETVRQLTNKIFASVKEDLAQLPMVWRKPKILRYWLVNARRAQVAFAILILLVPFILIPLVDKFLAYIFSPVTEEALFGLFRTKRDNPYLEYATYMINAIIWGFAFLVCVYLLLRNIPDALWYSRKKVEEHIDLADKNLKIKPSESVLLYNAATEWNTDNEYEKVILTKMDNINKTVFEEIDKTQVIMPQGLPLQGSQGGVNTVIADRYAIKKLLGSGAMGNVYLAEDTRLKRDVALKLLAPGLSSNDHLIARFRQEALALARLSHPNIVQVYDFFGANSYFWIVMEFVRGGELDSKLKDSGKLELKEALSMARQMAAALSYAHEQGVVHRDFKPANVLLTPNADIKISDFGIAKLAQSSLHTQLNTVLGTPSYMSPEQASGEETDHRTDIYALGIVFYQLLSGELPFKGDMKSIIAQHLTKPVPGLSGKDLGISPDIDRVLQKMLAKNPADRYQSMIELIQQLESVSKHH